MTGQEVIDQALITAQSEANRQLEAGYTLGSIAPSFLQQALDVVRTAWPFEWAQSISTPTIPTVVGPALTAAVYTLPTNMLEVVDIILDTGAIDTRKLINPPLRTFLTKWAAQLYLPMDKPTDWARINDTQFRVAPTPNAVYQMTVVGVLTAQVPDVSQQITQVPLRYHEVLIHGVATRMASAIRDGAIQAKEDEIFRQLIGNMIVEDKRQPDVEYQLRAFRGVPSVFTTAYWANPFVRRVE